MHKWLFFLGTLVLLLTACSAVQPPVSNTQEPSAQDIPAISLTGIAEEARKNIKFGEKFTYYGLMDQSGTMADIGSKVTLVWSNGHIAATYITRYDFQTGMVRGSSFGPRFVNELNEVLLSTDLDLSRGVVFGGGQNRQFATDGIHILMWPAVGNPDMFIDDPLSDEAMQALCGTMWENATDRFYGIDPAK